MIVATISQEEAVKKALEVERLEAVLKQMKAELKAYVDANGALVAGDKMWDYTISTAWEFTGEKLKEMSLEIAVEGRDPWGLLSLSAAAIKKLGWNETTLSRFGTKKETKRFDSRKAN